MTLKRMALSAALTLGCITMAVPVFAQRGAERNGYPPQPGASGFGGPHPGTSFGGPSPGGAGQGSPYGNPQGAPSFYAPSGRGSGSPMQSVPATRYGSVSPGSSVYRGPLGAPPVQGRSSAPNGPAISPSPAYRGPSPADTSRMQQALRRRDFEALGKESQGVRSRAEHLERMGPELPVQDRLKLPLLNKMYRQGADLLDEGRSKHDESKIRMGIQQINEANQKFGRLEGEIHDRSENRQDNRSQGRGRGRSDR